MLILLGAILAGVGLWGLLPGATVRARLLGAVLAAAGLGLVAAQVPGVGGWIDQSLFSLLAVVAVGSAAGAISLRNPVYAAIWFGMSLVATAGLLLFQGAQFLAVATIIVYAGAILVTFLFVLMLAEPSGRAPYDRQAWEGLVSALSGALLVGILSLTVARVLADPAEVVSPTSVPVTDRDPDNGILAEDHVRQIGQVLFDLPQSTGPNRAPKPGYLIAVEAAGVLLLSALVGAAAIVGRARTPRPDPATKSHPTHSAGGPSHA
jgi:NADH-quinone oxidoreductase subunit J